MKQIWKAKLMVGRVYNLMPKIEFDKDDENFLISYCVNPQDIVEFPACNVESAQRIAEFMAKEINDRFKSSLIKIPADKILNLNDLTVYPHMKWFTAEAGPETKQE
jgi:hypothetical protein